METNSLFARALIAERNYDAELQRLFGKDAVNARYDRKRNESTPELQRLAIIWAKLTDELMQEQSRREFKAQGLNLN